MSSQYLVFEKSTGILRFVENMSDHLSGVVSKNNEYFYYIESPDDYVRGDEYKIDGDLKLIKLSDTDVINKDRDSIIGVIVSEIDSEKTRRIQTVPEDVRKVFGKEGEKYYKFESWVYFMSMCDRILYSNTRDERYSAAKWVIDRILKLDNVADRLKKKIIGYSIDTLKVYDARNDRAWAEEPFQTDKGSRR